MWQPSVKINVGPTCQSHSSPFLSSSAAANPADSRVLPTPPLALSLEKKMRLASPCFPSYGFGDPGNETDRTDDEPNPTRDHIEWKRHQFPRNPGLLLRRRRRRRVWRDNPPLAMAGQERVGVMEERQWRSHGQRGSRCRGCGRRCR